MLIFLSTITSISLLRNSINNYKLKYISFYINLKSFKAFISYNYYFKKTKFLVFFYTFKEFYKSNSNIQILVNKFLIKIYKFKEKLNIIK
jgi:hypothetical protein